MCRPLVIGFFLLAMGDITVAEASGPTTRASIIVRQQAGGNPWTNLNVQNDPDDFQIVIVTDRTGGARPGVFEDAVNKINILRPEFVMSVGDLIQGYTENKATLEREWKEFNGFVSKLKMPFFYVPGNHDASNKTQLEDWKQRFGRLYYHFVYRNVLFLCLCTDEPAPARMSDEQIEYFRKALDQNKQVRWTLVFMHRPLWEENGEAAKCFAKFEPLLGGRKYTVFAGHVHTYLKAVRNDQRYITLATTGGGSRLEGPLFGLFDEVAWMTMTDDGPVLANLQLQGIWGEDLRTDESAKRIANLRRSAKLSYPAIAIDEPTFRATSLTLRVTNDADEPMRFKADFKAHPKIVVSPHAIDQTVPPNSVDEIELKLSSNEPIALDSIRPVGMNVSMSYSVADFPMIDFQTKHTIEIEGPLTIPRSSELVHVDGKLDEWKDLSYASDRPITTEGNAASWMGPNDGSFRFGVRQDDHFLYIGVNALDDRLRIDDEAKGRFEDGLTIRVDARPAAKRKWVNPKQEEDYYSVVSVHPAHSPDGTLNVDTIVAAPGTKAAAVRTPTGYSAEIAIPFEYLDEKQGKPWQDVRVNITMTDSDDPGMPAVELWWRPNWNSDQNYPASGTFRRD